MSRPMTLLLGAVAVVLLGAVSWAGVQQLRSVGRFQGYSPEQPIPYSHKLHAGEYRIECLYCHFGAEKSRHAGIPPLNVCMNCHREIDKKSRALTRLKEAWAQGRPIRWIKIHNLPDFVYFSHRQHMAPAARGDLECQDCHGPIETMEQVRQHAPLTMGWCLDCHQEKGITEFSEPEVARAAAEHAERAAAPPTQAPSHSSAEARTEPPRSPETDRPLGGMDCAKCHY